LSLPDPIGLKGTTKEIIGGNYREIQRIGEMGTKPDVIFIAMHGPYGEDGTVQGMFELVNIPYTGSGVLASAIGMDKIVFRKILKNENILIPKYTVYKKGDDIKNIKYLPGKLPYFVKPHNQGSSVGNSIAKSKKSLVNKIKIALKYSDKVLIDEYLKGVEVTCGILGNENPKALPLVEIIPKKAEFFDYSSKYSESGSEEIVPARISDNLTKNVQKIAIEVYKTIGCRGFARVDFILKDGKYPYVLEINTIPGLTPMSLLPRAANYAGINYSDLLDKILSYAIKK
jgi:D-alanine-D-alanine ligase